VGLLVVYEFILQPYSDALADIAQKHDAAAQELQDDSTLFSRQKVLKVVWTDMQTHGLKTDESRADSQLQHAILDWEQVAGVNQQTLKQDQPRKEGDFTVIGYRLTADGSMRGIARFLWALEKATIPIRVTDVRITPEREGGTDQLLLTIGVSTVCAPTEGGETPPNNGGGVAPPAGATTAPAQADAGGM
jgi:hypothetical protein